MNSTIRLLGDRVFAQREQLLQRGSREFSQPTFARADNAGGKFLLAFDHLINLLFKRAGAEELVHLHVLLLPDAKRAVGRLILDRRIPPAIEVEDMVRGGEIEARASSFEREPEDARAVILTFEA